MKHRHLPMILAVGGPALLVAFFDLELFGPKGGEILAVICSAIGGGLIYRLAVLWTTSSFGCGKPVRGLEHRERVHGLEHGQLVHGLARGERWELLATLAGAIVGAICGARFSPLIGGPYLGLVLGALAGLFLARSLKAERTPGSRQSGSGVGVNVGESTALESTSSSA